MDLTFTNLFSRLSEKEEVRILMVGLDAAGKTTILYKLKLGGVDTPIPATAFKVETVEYDNVLLTVWDVCKIRPPWRHYFHNAHGVIFVVDSNNRDTIDEARRQLHRMLLADELTDAAVLVIANKTDLPNAMNTEEITAKLLFNELQQRHKHIQRASATSGDGLYEGLDWLSNNIKDMKTSQPRKVFSHMFLPTDCDFINMLQIIRAGGDLGHDGVTATDPYEDHPDKLFGKLKPSIILRDEFCMSVNSVKGTQGFMRGVATGGRWKAYGGKGYVKKSDKKIGESTELAFYEPREGESDKLTTWRMREYDTDVGADCKTICVVFNTESRIRKVYKELDSLISPQEKTKLDKGKSKVEDGVEKKKNHELTQIKDRLVLDATGARDIPLSVYRDSVNSAYRDSINSAKGNVSGGESSSVSAVKVYETRSRSSVALKFLNDVRRRSRSKVEIQRGVGKGKASAMTDMGLKWVNQAKRASNKPNYRADVLEIKTAVVETEVSDSDSEVGSIDDSDTEAPNESAALEGLQTLEAIRVLDTLSKQRNKADPASLMKNAAVVDTNNENSTEATKKADPASLMKTAAVVDTNNENSKEATKKGVPLRFANLFSRLSAKEEVRILMVGLEAAGKTTILNKLKLEEVVITNPITGFNMKTGQYKNLIFTVWDVGKVDMYSQSHQQYFQNAYGLIFVVDSSDPLDRIDEASRELNKMLNQDKLADAAVLVFANKTDLPNAMKTDKITARLHFNQLQQRHKHIQRASATSGDGLYEGLDWLSNNIKVFL